MPGLNLYSIQQSQGKDLGSIDISFPESESSTSLVDESQEQWILEAIKNGAITDTYKLDHLEFED